MNLSYFQILLMEHFIIPLAKYIEKIAVKEFNLIGNNIYWDKGSWLLQNNYGQAPEDAPLLINLPACY